MGVVGVLGLGPRICPIVLRVGIKKSEKTKDNLFIWDWGQNLGKTHFLPLSYQRYWNDDDFLNIALKHLCTNTYTQDVK